jgi:hypothetical protein
MSNNNVEIIGFDLGHGETALAKIFGDNPEPRKLLLHKQNCQPTMIAYYGEQVLFGEQALNNKATDFQISFKKRPTSEPNYQKVMKDYVNAIYQHLLQTKQLNKEENNYFFVGCPSGWKEEREEYEKLFKSSHLPEVRVIKESFAALMHAVKSDLLTGSDIKGNVLVIDVGSSTTDCTFVKEAKHEDDGDFGIDLGAALIDKAILNYSLSQNEDREDIERAFEQITLLRHRCEFMCRQNKEEYFCNSINYMEEDSLVRQKYEKIQKAGVFEPIVYKKVVEQIISQPLNNCLGKYKDILPPLQGVDFRKSWQENFRQFLQSTKKQLETKGIKINTILLTGSASKMDFIPQIVHEVFINYKHVQDSEPGLCIAMGLARWGKKSINSIHFLEEVEQFLQKDLPKIFTDKVASLRSKLTENLVEGLSYKVIKPALLDWRNRSGIYTINNLESVIISRVKTWLEGMGGQEVIKKAISNWVNDDLVPSMKEKTDIICKKYGLGLDQLVPYSLTYNPTADKLTSETLNLADPTVMTPIINWIIGIVVTVITLFLATTVIGLIIGLFVLFGLQGWAEETIKDWDIPKKPRGWVNNDKISEMTSEIKGKLTGGVEKAIAEDIKFIDKILNQVKDGLSKEVRKQADSVKILIS